MVARAFFLLENKKGRSSLSYSRCVSVSVSLSVLIDRIQ